MKADIFSRVAWQLRTRSGVNIYAWMPVLSWDLDPTLTRVKYLPTGEKKHKFILNNTAVSLLSMTGSEHKLVCYMMILPDMLLFDGILFHDDALLSDYEDASAAAIAGLSASWL